MVLVSYHSHMHNEQYALLRTNLWMLKNDFNMYRQFCQWSILKAMTIWRSLAIHHAYTNTVKTCGMFDVCDLHLDQKLSYMYMLLHWFNFNWTQEATEVPS